MKAILTVSLYQRPQATNEVEAAGYLPEGSLIDVKQVVSGKPVDGISIWCLADDGFHYWAGGLDFSDANSFAAWDAQPQEFQKSLLESLVSDELYWFEKMTVGYIGCGWGYKNDVEANGLAVSVFVDKKTATAVLGKTTRYKGFDVPVDVKPVKPFHQHLYQKHSKPPITPDIFNPVQMGGSISVANQQGYGTRSMALRNKAGKSCLMTCFHVLLGPYKSKGKFPLNPPQQVLAESPSKARNPFNMKVNNSFVVLEGRYNAYYDFAMTEIPAGLQYRNAFNNTDFTTYYLVEDLKNLIGQTVTMAGATSILQSGKVLEVRGSLPVNDTHICNNIIVTEMIAKGGDSGAPVLDQNGKLIGIVVAGNEDDRTLVLPVTFLFTELGYKFL